MLDPGLFQLINIRNKVNIGAHILELPWWWFLIFLITEWTPVVWLSSNRHEAGILKNGWGGMHGEAYIITGKVSLSDMFKGDNAD